MYIHFISCVEEIALPSYEFKWASQSNLPLYPWNWNSLLKMAMVGRSENQFENADEI